MWVPVGVVAHLGVTPKLSLGVEAPQVGHELSNLVPLLGGECVGWDEYLFSVITGDGSSPPYEADLNGGLIEAPAG